MYGKTMTLVCGDSAITLTDGEITITGQSVNLEIASEENGSDDSLGVNE